MSLHLEVNTISACRGSSSKYKYSTKHPIWTTVFARLFAKCPRPGDSEGNFSVLESVLAPITTSLTT